MIYKDTKYNRLTEAKDKTDAFLIFYKESRKRGEEPACLEDIEVWGKD